jgi:hypothetical protein
MGTTLSFVISLAAISIVVALFKRCWQHDYELIERVYAPPHGVTLHNSRGGPPRDADGNVSSAITTTDRVLHGTTTLIFQCTKCKKLHREEALGKSVFGTVGNRVAQAAQPPKTKDRSVWN